MDIQAKLLKLGLSKTVYSLLYPEAKKVLDNLWNEKPHSMYERPYLDKQDGSHLDFFNTWLNWTSSVLKIDKGLIKYFYPTAGSSEAIRDSIAVLASKFLTHAHQPSIHVFDGEYEGYASYARAFGLRVVKHNRSEYEKSLEKTRPVSGDLFYLSQPSSIDGNVWTGYDDFMIFLSAKYPDFKVMLDICYVGTVAKSYQINLTFSNIESVFFSLSKVFGVYYHRIGGVFSRNEISSLHGNRYFKNLFSLRLGTELMTRYGVQELPNKYYNAQFNIIKQLNKKFPDILPSDVVILAHGPKKKGMYGQLTRGDSVRVCITPSMDKELNYARD